MASLILPPILQLMLFGSVMNPSVANMQLGIVDDSQSPASRDLVAALSESGSFTLTGVYQSVDALGDDISLGTIDAGVVIPSDFARDLDRGRSSTVQVLLNAMNANTAAISQGYVQGVIQSFNATRPVAVQPVDHADCRGPATRRGIALLHPALLYNPGGVSTWFIVTGLLGTLLIMNGTITASTTMVKEREAGTLEQLLMTPAGMTEIIVAKIVPPFVLLAMPAVMALIVIRFYFERAVQRQRAAHRGVVGALPAVRHRDRHGRRDDHEVGAAGAAGDLLHHAAADVAVGRDVAGRSDAGVDAALDRSQSRLPLRRHLARQPDQGQRLRRALAASAGASGCSRVVLMSVSVWRFRQQLS